MSTVYSVLKIQKELNAHIAAAYVRFQFTCRYCKKQYASANRCAKHEKSHGGYNFECEFCHKNFYFQEPCQITGRYIHVKNCIHV